MDLLNGHYIHKSHYFCILACEPILSPATFDQNGAAAAKCLSILCGQNQNTYVQQVPVPVQQPYNPYGGYSGFGGFGGLGGGFGGLGGGFGGLFFDEVLEEEPVAE